jgi:energy-coupling factor transporter ATP-binding protein EcfA2
VLLLDEPSSASDPESEAALQRSLSPAATGGTTITVTHRLANAREADVIIVMDQGRIVDAWSASGPDRRHFARSGGPATLGEHRRRTTRTHMIGRSRGPPIRRGGESQVDQMRGRCYVRAAGFGIGAPIAAGAGL